VRLPLQAAAAPTVYPNRSSMPVAIAIGIAVTCSSPRAPIRVTTVASIV
jgi:hypothetical protein